MKTPTMPRSLTVTVSTFVARPPEVVWDYTQDSSRRREWNSWVLAVNVVATDPVLKVRIRARGGLEAVFQYKQFDRPRRTSLSMEEVRSPWISGGGGAWSYEAKEGGTLWTQTNTLVLRDRWWCRLFAPLLQRQLAGSTRRAMDEA